MTRYMVRRHVRFDDDEAPSIDQFVGVVDDVEIAGDFESDVARARAVIRAAYEDVDMRVKDDEHSLTELGATATVTPEH